MMGTSPPMQKAPTVKTLSARSVAAPASAAFPPASRILVPASLAAALPDTTIPLLPIALLAALVGWGVFVGFAGCALANGRATSRSSLITKRQIHEAVKPHLRILFPLWKSRACPTPTGCSTLPGKAQAELCHPRVTARIPRAQYPGVRDGSRVVRVVEHVEEVQVEPQHDPLLDAPDLEQRRVLEPLPGAVHVLVPPRVQVVVIRHALHRAVVQRQPDIIGIPERRHVCPGRSICRKRGLTPRDQRRGRRLVVRRNAHDAVRFSLGVDTVDPVGRNVTVPPQVAGVAVAALAILDRIFVAVNLDRVSGSRIDVGRQSPVRSLRVPQSGNLPATHQLLHDALEAPSSFLPRPNGRSAMKFHRIWC